MADRWLIAEAKTERNAPGAQAGGGAIPLPAAPSASSPAARAVMRGNRRRDTRAELALRSALHAQGLRYRVDLKIGSGRHAPRPDVAFTRARVAVFVDGCFWHGCPEHGVKPRTNSDYWKAKVRRNQDRDARNDKALRTEGWLVMRVWEHEDPKEAAVRVAGVVRERLRHADVGQSTAHDQ